MGLMDRLLDLIYPPKCKYCGAFLEHKTVEPCPKCDRSLFLEGAQVLVPGTHFTRCVSVAWYRDKLRQEVRRFKFGGQPGHAQVYGPKLAQIIRFYLPGSYDVITWVPVSQATLEERGYDQARLLAEAAAEALGTTAAPLLVKTCQRKAQSSLTTGQARFQNVKGVYKAPDPGAVKGKRILLVDDILTTGATLEEAARTLKQAGAVQVVAATFCRTPKGSH